MEERGATGPFSANGRIERQLDPNRANSVKCMFCRDFYGYPREVAILKRKGDLAELKVASDLLSRSYQVALPYGEDWDFDLLLFREGRFERVQVKYTESDGQLIIVRCRSQSLTGGRVIATKRYTAAQIDWLAIYDVTSDHCYYIPAHEMAEGRDQMTLRLSQPFEQPAGRGTVRRPVPRLVADRPLFRRAAETAYA